MWSKQCGRFIQTTDEKVLTHVHRQECFEKYLKGNETWLPSVVALGCMFYNRSIFKNILVLIWMDLTYVLRREHWELRVRCNSERTYFLSLDTMSLRISLVMTIRYNIWHLQWTCVIFLLFISLVNCPFPISCDLEGACNWDWPIHVPYSSDHSY